MLCFILWFSANSLTLLSSFLIICLQELNYSIDIGQIQTTTGSKGGATNWKVGRSMHWQVGGSIWKGGGGQCIGRWGRGGQYSKNTKFEGKKVGGAWPPPHSYDGTTRDLQHTAIDCVGGGGGWLRNGLFICHQSNRSKINVRDQSKKTI